MIEIHWIWIPIIIGVSFFAGWLIAALCAVSGYSDERAGLK